MFKRLDTFFSLIFYFLLALLFYGLAIITRQFNQDFGWSIRGLGLIINLIIFSIYGYRVLIKREPFRIENLMAFIILGGFFIRLSYAYTTGPFLRQHDVAQIDLQTTGHYGYILTIIRTGGLPTSNGYQFYHPPLYHALAAVWLRMIELIFSPQNPTLWFDTLAIFSLMVSQATLILSYKVMKMVKMNPLSSIIMMLLLTYHPIFILFAGRHNNDPLSYLFTVWIIHLFLIWWKEKKARHLYLMGLAIGLGMLTKVSVGLITPVIGVLMVVRLFQEKEIWKKYAFEYLIFALIVLPIGLSFIIRNYLLFNQAPTFVWEITNPALSTAEWNWIERFLPFELTSFFTRLYANAGEDYNLWIYLTKTSIFGEFSYWGGHLFSLILLALNVILVFLSTVLVVLYPIYLKRKWRIEDYLLYGYGALLIISYVVFNIRYPYGPTMDFRYLVITILLVGYVFTQHPLLAQYQNKIAFFFVIFSIASSLFFTFLF